MIKAAGLRAGARLDRVRSVWLAWGALVAIDLTSRVRYLAPRLLTARGALNYAVASAALWTLLRLAATLGPRLRLLVVALLVALPMAVEWGMFRAYGQFVEPTDFIALWVAPQSVLRAAGGGSDPRGMAVVFVLATACAWMLPRSRRVLRRPAVVLSFALLVAITATGASYWRAAPTLEHSQPAFFCALAGVARRATTRLRAARTVTIPANPSVTKLPNVVLILGESLAASHVSLYGYERDTTPRLRALAARGEIVVLRDAVVLGPHTRTSVPYIMTGLEGPDPSGRVFGAPNVFEYAKARGYHTAFVSAQEESWGDLDALLRPGVELYKTGLHFAPDVDVLKGSDDLVVLREGALPTIASLTEPFFLVLHMDGSHVPYGHHSPPSHKVWDESDGVNSIAAYDNTIRVTDEYVARVFEATRARDPEAWLFFTSDHGQALGEGGAFYHRGYQSNVVKDPLLVFPPSPAAKASWTALANAPISACDLAPTILGLMGTTPDPRAPMDCVDLLAGPVAPRARVVSAYTPAFLAEPTMLVLLPDGRRALYDLYRETVVLDDGVIRPLAEAPMPPSVRARLDAARR